MTFEQLANQLIDTQKRKNADYGSSFDQTLDEFGLVASATRMSDKFNRFKSLMRYGSTAQVEDEKIEATDDEVEARVKEMAESQGKKAPDIKKNMGARQLDYIKNDIIVKKLFEVLKSGNTIE